MLKITSKKTLNGIAVLAALAAILLTFFATQVPSFEALVTTAQGSDRVLLAGDGQVVQTLRTDFSKRRLAWHPLPSFPESLQAAVLNAEDQRFYHHLGLDPIGLGRAFWAILRHHRVQGASTITMQVTDLIQDEVLTRNQAIRKGSFIHKLGQIGRALALEMKWNKSEILEAYLNLVHLRGEFQGVPATAAAYLKKSPLGLDNAENFVIAAMISSPNQGPASLKRRACHIAKASDCTATDAAAEAFMTAQPSLPSQMGNAAHLARRLFQGQDKSTILRSTLDAGLQHDVAAILEKNISRLKGSNVRDSAAIVIENSTGRVLAYVGAVSSSESPHVDGVQAYRQAGSSLKPFLYGKAIDQKLLTAASVLLDEPTAISWNGDVYRPTNYDQQFNGPVAVREALASSLNVPAVKTVTIIGLRQSYHVLESLHLTNLKDPDFYGVSLALGAVDVRLDELANAYRMLANGGRWSPLTFLDGQTAVSTKEQLYSPDAAFIISSILSDPDARTIGFGWESPLETPFWTAVKTGTSKDYRDNWCVGFSERYTVGVWAGNFNSEAMDKVSGVSGVGPSWAEIMARLHSQLPSRAPTRPAGVVAKDIRHSWASHEHREYFMAGTEPASGVIEPVLEKRLEFVFPAEGSVLIRDPHTDPRQIALFARFKGTAPAGSRLLWDGKDQGEAVSPFKLMDFSVGSHELALRTREGLVLTRVRFTVRGGGAI